MPGLQVWKEETTLEGPLGHSDVIPRRETCNQKGVETRLDLIELNGDDLRRDPLEVRKAMLASIVAKAQLGIRFNEHIEGDGPTVFAHACKLGLEGIVSKRKDSPYRSRRSPDWLKMKNSDAPDAVGLARGSVHSVTS